MRLMRSAVSFLAVLTSAVAVFWTSAASATGTCELDRPVRFSGLNWESNLVLAGVERFIVEHGYGCETSVEIGETMAMLAALQRGDVDVTPEVWPGQIEFAWDKAEKSGKILAAGHVFDAGEGWYIPRYTLDRYPELKQAADLAKFAKVFTDPEDPSKGRIYGCPAGWACGTLSANLLKALKLEDKYTLFAPGSGAAQKAAITSAYKRKRDIVFYYWTPTALAGSLDLVKLALPPFDQAAYTCMTDPKCENPVPTEFKSNRVVTGLNTEFAHAAPQLQAFFTKVSMPGPVIDDTLGWMEKEHAEPEDAALYFLHEYPDVWKKWVPVDVADRVQEKL